MYKNLAKIIREASSVYANEPAFGIKTTGRIFETKTFQETYEMATNLGYALLNLGILPGDRIAIIADNRYEWILADLAIMMVGACDVPRGADVTDFDITYILNHAEVKTIFIENKKVLELIRKNQANLPLLEKIIIFESSNTLPENCFNLYDLVEKGKEFRKLRPNEMDEKINSIQENDLFTIIYTSGTTGQPKGVMLTHKNIVSQLEFMPIAISPADRVISILPIWHIFERVFEMIALSKGCCTYYSNIRTLKDDLKIVKPTFMASAPRLWESIYSGILANLEKASLSKRILFKTAYFFAEQFHGSLRWIRGKNLKLKRENFFIHLARVLMKILIYLSSFLPYLLLDRLVLKKVRDVTGGKLRGSVSGGGALPYHVDLFFNHIGIPALEGYGMTETSPVIAVRTLDHLVIGTVGPIFKGTEVRIVSLETQKVLYPGVDGYAKKGEIHVRGPQVMKGYYNNEEATNKTIQDGWLNTGDLGIMTYNDCLKIVGRSKETIVLLSGENVEPTPIESKLVQSPLIDSVLVVGQDQKFLSALIVPNLQMFLEYGKDLSSIAAHPKTKEILLQEVKKLVSAQTGFKSFERVIDIRILPKAFELGDELTPKLSVKRNVVQNKYKEIIDEIYKSN